MVVDTIVNSIPTPIMTFGGSAIAGFFIGMLLKRVLKIILIIVGSFLGVFGNTIYVPQRIPWRTDKLG
jgi:uncharacterized membrane protein (Fun14 family)